jgi:hypothetical protein
MIRFERTHRRYIMRDKLATTNSSAIVVVGGRIPLNDVVESCRLELEVTMTRHQADDWVVDRPVFECQSTGRRTLGFELYRTKRQWKQGLSAQDSWEKSKAADAADVRALRMWFSRITANWSRRVTGVEEPTRSSPI